MKATVIAMFLMTALVAACGGGSTPTTAPRPTGGPAQSTPAPGQATPATATQAPATQAAASQAPATQAPNPGGGAGDVANVVLASGPDAGTYTASGNPFCSHGFVGQGVWGAQLTGDGGEGQLSQLQIVFPDPGVQDAHLSMTLTIGPLMSGTTYHLLSGGNATATDNGNTAVLHITGTTDEGVDVDVTVNCPSVTRA